MPDLTVELFGHKLANPVMPAAGPNCRNAEMLLRAAEGGAGALLMKTVSVKPAPVPFPNIVAYRAHSLLNAELWSELPVEQYIDHEYRGARTAGLMQIASLGYTAEELTELGPRIEATGAVDALECSVHYLGRDLTPVVEAMRALKQVVSLPVILKLSPAIGDVPALVELVDQFVDGYAAINSLGPCLDFNPATLQPTLGAEGGYGWLSGEALLPLALRFVHQLAQCTAKPILGVGGVRRGEDAVKMLMAGATAVQVCTAAIREGQGVYGRIAAELDAWLSKHGYVAASDIIGLYAKEHHTVDRAPRKPVVDADLCARCGACVKACPHGASKVGDDGLPVIGDKCLGCGYCASICPRSAMRMETI